MITRQRMNEYWRKYASMATAMGESREPYDRANAELARLASEMWHSASSGQVEELDWESNPSIKSYEKSKTFDPRGPLEEFKAAWNRYCRSGVITGEVGRAIDTAMRMPPATSQAGEASAGMANPPPKKGKLDERIPQDLREYIHEGAAQSIIMEYEIEFKLDQLKEAGETAASQAMMSPGVAVPPSAMEPIASQTPQSPVNPASSVKSKAK